ncbi:MAG: endoglucanase A, partial [Myxococcales bacterium]|nr:endoglucanase A [Myxococcales bacterium]
DNEPALWASTHAKLHPAALTYAELLSRTIEAAAMIKALSPKAIVLGPVLYGYTAYINLQDAPDAGEHGDFLSYYLDRLESEEATRQQRLVDVLDLHWYPEARGGGVRIIGTETGAAVVAARLQAPRSLWDPSYVEESWITDCCVEGGIDLLGGLKKRIALHYPGTKLSFSEYYYGAGQHISGAIAQADVLGIFGREGVFAATLWPLDDKLAFIHAAFKLFLDFDGAGGRFGDTSVEALTNDDAKSSVYASVDAADPGRMVLVLLNKTNGVLDAALTIQHSLAFTQAALFRVSGSSPAIQTLAPLSLEQTNAFNLSLPPMSVTTVLLTP